MFALMMCEDRVSMQPRRRQIIDGLHLLPGTVHYSVTYRGLVVIVDIAARIQYYSRVLIVQYNGHQFTVEQ